MKRWLAVVAIGLVVVLVVGGVVALVESDGPTAVEVGSTTISQQSVDDELGALRDNTSLQKMVAQQSQQGAPQISHTKGSVTSDLGSGWLGLIIAQIVAQREVERRGLTTTSADKTQGKSLAVQSIGGSKVYSTMPTWFQDRLVKRWTPVATLQRDVLANPTPDLVKAAGQQCPSGRYVSHILVQTEAEAQAIKRALDAGGDFAKLATSNSTDASAQDGGQLGCIDGQNFAEPFATAAATQPIGVPSDPVQTQFGYHIILVTDQPSASALASASIDEILSRSAGHKHVAVDPRYGTWNRRTGQVLPPAVPGAVPAATP
jgi:PPIC-type PPIASE domain